MSSVMLVEAGLLVLRYAARKKMEGSRAVSQAAENVIVPGNLQVAGNVIQGTIRWQGKVRDFLEKSSKVGRYAGGATNQRSEANLKL